MRDGEDLAAAFPRPAAPAGFAGAALSAGARQALCHFAAGDLERPFPPIAVDWEEVLQGLGRHGLLGLARRYLARHGGAEMPGGPPESFRRAVARAQSLTALRLAVLYRGIGATLGGLVEAGIEPIVLKGPALDQVLYPEPGLRAFGDLDLLIREQDLVAADRALLAQGFEAGRALADLVPLPLSRLTAHELQYWHPQRQLLVEFHLNDPFSAGLAARDLAGLWRRAAPLVIQGVAVRALAPEDQLLQLCTHAHYHSYARLNWLADLAFLVRDHGASLDWARFVAAARAEELQVPAYYSLRFLGQLLDVHAPAAVLVDLCPDRFRRRWHEYHLPEARVLACGPVPRPFAGFYFSPLCARLLPDLLVMGRRREKLLCLLRLLAPAPTWLRAYYRLDASELVAPHYLLHPAKLLAHYLAEVARLAIGIGRGRLPASLPLGRDDSPDRQRAAAGQRAR